MIDNGKLSIITPYYNTYELTNKLIEILLPQLTEETEWYIIDDGCHEKRLDKYRDKINIIHLAENKGATIAMNIALQQAKGKYIAIIDSDDMITNDYIEVLLQTIREHKEDVIYFDWQDMHSRNIVHHPTNYAPWKAIYKKTIMPLFREGWIFSYDVPFQEDLKKVPHTEYYIDKVLYIYNSNRPGNLTLLKEKCRRGGDKMVKVEVIEYFSLEKFDELKNLVRHNAARANDGYLYVGDTFECDMDMVNYLIKDNRLHKAFVKVIEVIPAKEEQPKEEVKEVKKKTTKKSVAKK